RARARLPRHGLLGIGDGSEERRRHLRQLPRLSAETAAGVLLDGRRVPLPRRRRTPADRQDPGRAPQERRGVSRVERETRRTRPHALNRSAEASRSFRKRRLALLPLRWSASLQASVGQPATRLWPSPFLTYAICPTWYDSWNAKNAS